MKETAQKLMMGLALMLITMFAVNGNVYAESDQGSGGGNGSENEFAGLKFGVGLSLTGIMGDKSRGVEAEVINGIVRVTQEQKAIARIMLESHYFFTPQRNALFNLTKSGHWGHGPFVAVQPGSQDIIEAIGLGWMIGFKKDNLSHDQSNNSWNIGVGAVVDPNVKTLGDGVDSNQPLPTGETAIRYNGSSSKKRTKKSCNLL